MLNIQFILAASQMSHNSPTHTPTLELY